EEGRRRSPPHGAPPGRARPRDRDLPRSARPRREGVALAARHGRDRRGRPRPALPRLPLGRGAGALRLQGRELRDRSPRREHRDRALGDLRLAARRSAATRPRPAAEERRPRRDLLRARLRRDARAGHGGAAAALLARAGLSLRGREGRGAARGRRAAGDRGAARVIEPEAVAAACARLALFERVALARVAIAEEARDLVASSLAGVPSLRARPVARLSVPRLDAGAYRAKAKAQ